MDKSSALYNFHLVRIGGISQNEFSHKLEKSTNEGETTQIFSLHYHMHKIVKSRLNANW